MTTQATPSNSSRPRSLLDLPTEVLAEIVRMCAEQDRAFRHRSALLRSHYCADPAVESILDRQQDDGMGSSLKVVSLISRVMSQLAKPHLFLTLKTSRTVDSPAFWYDFATTCLAHIRHLILDTGNLPALDFVLAFLDSFKNLEELTITQEAAGAIFPNNRSEASRASRYIYRPSTLSGKKLKSRESKFRKLNLLSCPASVALDCLDVFNSVQNLRYKGPLPDSTIQSGRFIKVLNRIDSIILEDPNRSEGSPFTIPPSLLKVKQSAPRLSHISLETTKFDKNTLDWIMEFRQCLRTLTITSDSDQFLPESPTSSLQALDLFPRLHSISIIGSSLIASAIFRDTNRNTFPSLQHIRLSYDEVTSRGFADDDEALHAIFRTFHFVHLQYDPPNQYFPLTFAEALVQRAAVAKVHLQLHNYAQASVPSSHFVEDDEDYSARYMESFVDLAEEERSKDQVQLTGGLDRIKEHLERRVNAATRDQNVAELYRLSILLRPLEYDRLAQLD